MLLEAARGDLHARVRDRREIGDVRVVEVIEDRVALDAERQLIGGLAIEDVDLEARAALGRGLVGHREPNLVHLEAVVILVVRVRTDRACIGADVAAVVRVVGVVEVARRHPAGEGRLGQEVRQREQRTRLAAGVELAERLLLLLDLRVRRGERVVGRLQLLLQIGHSRKDFLKVVLALHVVRTRERRRDQKHGRNGDESFQAGSHCDSPPT